MEREQLSHIAHSWHPIAAPLSAASVDRLLGRVPLPGGPARAIDLGCGTGQWVVRLLARHPDLTAMGVDASALAIGRAVSLADEHGVGERATFTVGDAAAVDRDPVDVAMSVGASHALGGYESALRDLAGHLGGQGAAVFGEGFWTTPPTSQALDALGLDGPSTIPDLTQLAEAVSAAGFVLRTAHVSTPEEWDDYERSWCGALHEWADSAVEAPEEDRQQARQVATAHQVGYQSGYQGVLGFTTLVLTTS